MPAPAPYVPGMFAFREGPVLVAALERLGRTPCVLLVDGAGRAHPRRAGLATHLGVVLGLPAVGCAKSRLLGTYDEVPPVRGTWSPLRDGGETVGAVLRTRAGARPLFVSAGHRADLASAIELVLRCATRFRIPEPLRAADHAARAAASG